MVKFCEVARARRARAETRREFRVVPLFASERGPDERQELDAK